MCQFVQRIIDHSDNCLKYLKKTQKNLSNDVTKEQRFYFQPYEDLIKHAPILTNKRKQQTALSSEENKYIAAFEEYYWENKKNPQKLLQLGVSQKIFGTYLKVRNMANENKPQIIDYPYQKTILKTLNDTTFSIDCIVDTTDSLPQKVRFFYIDGDEARPYEFSGNINDLKFQKENIRYPKASLRIFDIVERHGFCIPILGHLAR